jgi:subtilisin family serine protease
MLTKNNFIRCSRKLSLQKNVLLYTQLICFSLLSLTSSGQFTRHIIQLKDKQGTPYTLQDASPYLSPKAIERRSRFNIALDSTDLPISAAYLDSIKKIPGVTILSVSKWLNQVLIKTSDANAITRINQFPFVNKLSPVALRVNPDDQELINKIKVEKTYPLPVRHNLFGTKKTVGTDDLISYGNSFAQIHIHEGEFLHNLGYTGRGVAIAMLDAGYANYDTNPALDSVRLQNRILGGHDFVTNQPVISEADLHGAYCFTIIASNKPGSIVGSAPASSFWLLRSEDGASEYPVEEHNWAAAAAYADSVGADIISSSLGYTSFSNPIFNHPYSERDGNTCVSTIAADLAARKGILVMNSAGNNGGIAGEERYVSCPADGDSVFAVGAVKPDGTIAGFSSWGPNYAGKVKPNVVSVGQGAIIANANGDPIAGNGTSFSNPNLAGLMACLWQAFPEFSNMELIDHVQRSAHMFANPDIRFGYGIPNFRVAYNLLKQENERRNAKKILGEKWIKAYPVPFNHQLTVIVKPPISGNASLRLIDMLGRTLELRNITTIANQSQFIYFSSMGRLAKGMCYIQYFDKQNQQTIPVVRF